MHLVFTTVSISGRMLMDCPCIHSTWPLSTGTWKLVGNFISTIDIYLYHMFIKFITVHKFYCIAHRLSAQEMPKTDTNTEIAEKRTFIAWARQRRLVNVVRFSKECRTKWKWTCQHLAGVRALVTAPSPSACCCRSKHAKCTTQVYLKNLLQLCDCHSICTVTFSISTVIEW